MIHTTEFEIGLLGNYIESGVYLCNKAIGAIYRREENGITYYDCDYMWGWNGRTFKNLDSAYRWYLKQVTKKN